MSPKQGHSKNSKPHTKEHLLCPEPDLPAQFSGHLVFIHVSSGGRGGAEEAGQREEGGQKPEKWGVRPALSPSAPAFPLASPEACAHRHQDKGPGLAVSSEFQFSPVFLQEEIPQSCLLLCWVATPDSP